VLGRLGTIVGPDPAPLAGPTGPTSSALIISQPRHLRHRIVKGGRGRETPARSGDGPTRTAPGRSSWRVVSSRAACAIGAMLVAGGIDRIPVAHRHDPLRTSRR
jgi:hypothetical protein